MESVWKLVTRKVKFFVAHFSFYFRFHLQADTSSVKKQKTQHNYQHLMVPCLRSLLLAIYLITVFNYSFWFFISIKRVSHKWVIGTMGLRSFLKEGVQNYQFHNFRTLDKQYLHVAHLENKASCFSHCIFRLRRAE